MSKHKKITFIIHCIKPTVQLLFKIRFPKGGPTCRRQVINPRHQTPQGQSVAKPETPLQNICSWVARYDIKGSVSTVLNPIFSKKVQLNLCMDIDIDIKSSFNANKSSLWTARLDICNKFCERQHGKTLTAETFSWRVWWYIKHEWNNDWNIFSLQKCCIKIGFKYGAKS